MRGAERRLRALERGQTVNRQASYDRLMALAESGKLTDDDLQRLTHEQLWWLVAGELVAMPPSDQLEHILREVIDSDQGREATESA